jgi:cyclopropane-fatty-acyl-phospholipid synthase
MVFTGKVMHARSWPVKHRFQYPLYFYAFDLDELSELDRSIPLFGYNRIRPVSIHDKNYLLAEPGSIRQKLDHLLARSGNDAKISRVHLVTSARYLNYVFNPVSFFYCYGADANLECIVVQVNNTFGEMHVYVLREKLEPRPSYLGHYSTEKAFHVSPFFDRKGSYEFFFSDIRSGNLDILIHYRQETNLVFTARLQGTSKILNTSNMASTLVRHPLAAVLTMPRIVWQAGRLRFQRRLPVFHKPPPTSPMTIRSASPGLLERAGRLAFFRFLKRLEKDKLSITFPDGREVVFGQPGSGREASFLVRDNAFFRRTLTKGGIGFGESFTAGEWVTPDITAVLTVLAENISSLKERHHRPSMASRLAEYIRHLSRQNTLRGSARNISDHYDLGNDFFSLFLDPTMTYSCALFESGNETLQEAQLNKLRSIADLAGIEPTHTVLEIGCGWGSFAIETSRSRGCHVTGITISREQLELSKERIRAAGLSRHVTLELKDYRRITGTYDRIVSIEMLEAVGHSNIGRFFAACDRALEPGGRAVIQVITIPEDRYNSYRKSSDWIRKHIFPGGHLPSIGMMEAALERHTALRIQDLKDIGPHYARTLRLWRENLLARREKVLEKGFDEKFLRKWEYYFSYCEAGFLTGAIQNHQLVLEREKG